VVDVHEEPLGSAVFAMDNYGSRSTGRFRSTLFTTASDPSGYGDLLRIGGAASEGTRSLFGSYVIPLGTGGLKFRVIGSALEYEIQHGSATALDLEGQASSAGVGLGYPIVRDRYLTLVGYVQGDGRFMRDSALGAYISHRYTRSVTAGSQYFWVRPGFWSINGDLNGTAGRLMPGDPDKAPGVGVVTSLREGNYAIGHASLTFDRAFGNRWSIQVAANGQVASQDLDSSEKIYAGGPGGVRAYPIEEGASDSGIIVRSELRWLALKRETYGVSLVGFYDWAHVKRNIDTYPGWNNVNPAMPNNYSLKGWGGGVRYNWSQFRLEALFAQKLGDNPGRSTAGQDADGSDHRSRVWLLATLFFQ
jgi:hemolysin activation/secretion protein